MACCYFPHSKNTTEFEASLAFYLDIALDGIVLYDPHGYMQAKLTRLQTLIRKKGLRREKIEGSFAWQWDRFPATLVGLSNGTHTDAKYRTGVPRGKSSRCRIARWRSAVDAQLAENAAKAVLALVGPVGRTHQPALTASSTASIFSISPTTC